MFLLFFSCLASQSSPSDSAVSNLPSEAFHSLTPEWTPDLAYGALSTLVDVGLPNPTALLSLYESMYLAGADGGCPGSNFNMDGGFAGTQGCLTDSGYSFYGNAEYRSDMGGTFFHCDCRIVAPDGQLFRGAGNVMVGDVEFSAPPKSYHAIEGSFVATDSSAWLSSQPSAVLRIEAGDGITLHGGYTAASISVYFHQLRFEDCEVGIGSFEIRDPSGGWWLWTREDCDAAARLTFEGLVTEFDGWDLSVIAQAAWTVVP